MISQPPYLQDVLDAWKRLTFSNAGTSSSFEIEVLYIILGLITKVLNWTQGFQFFFVS